MKILKTKIVALAMLAIMALSVPVSAKHRSCNSSRYNRQTRSYVYYQQPYSSNYGYYQPGYYQQVYRPVYSSNYYPSYNGYNNNGYYNNGYYDNGYYEVRRGPSKTKNIAVGAALGAVAGALIGGKTGAIVGAGAGAGAGYGVYKYRKNRYYRGY
jgi:hypothetical protein